MRCRQVRERLAEFLERDLEPEVAEEIRAHLDTCSTCRGERESLRAILATLAEYQRETSECLRAPDLPLGLQEAMQTPPSGRTLGLPAAAPWRRALAPAALAACATLAGVLTFGVRVGFGPSPAASVRARQTAPEAPAARVARAPSGEAPAVAKPPPSAPAGPDQRASVRQPSGQHLRADRPVLAAARIHRSYRPVSRIRTPQKPRRKPVRQPRPEEAPRTLVARTTPSPTGPAQSQAALPPSPPVGGTEATPSAAEPSGTAASSITEALSAVSTAAREINRNAVEGSVRSLALVAAPLQGIAEENRIQTRDKVRRALDELQFAAAGLDRPPSPDAVAPL